MEMKSQLLNGLIVLAVLCALSIVFVRSRRRGRKIREYSQNRMHDNHEILLYSTGEGLAALMGVIFLAYAFTAFEEAIWKGLFASSAGVGGLAIWARYARCVSAKPCLVLNKQGIESPLYGSISWSNVESVGRIELTVRFVEIDYLVLKLKDMETARQGFAAPLRWLHQFGLSRELKFKIANMSLPGDDVLRYAKTAIR